MKRYRVNHRFSTSYYPQTSGQVENTKRALKRILEKIVKDNHAIWSRKLDDAPWAFRIAYKTRTGDDANKYLDKFLHVTQSIKVNGVTDDTLRLYLFPHSLTHHATVWFDRLPRNSINTFEQMAKMFLEKYFPPFMVTKLRNEITNFRQHTFYNGLTLRHRDTINAAIGGTFMKRHPEECYDLIENMTSHHNDWDTSAQRSESPSSITSSFDTEIAALKAKMAEINKNLMRVLQVSQQVKAVTPNCEACGGPHSFSDCPATVGNTQNVYAARAYQVSAPRPNQRPSIPYPSRLQDQKLRDKANDQREFFFQIFKDLIFNISFVDALILMPKFGPSIKSLLTNKDKLRELARTPLNEHYSVILLKKLPKTLGDPGKFLIPCKLTLRVGKEAITFNLDQTSRYSANNNDMTANRIDVIDMACKEYSQEVLSFFDVIASGNPTPYYDLIVSTTSLTLTPFENSDFLLEEVDAFLALEDDPTSPEVDQSYVDTEGDILLLEAFLNDDPSLPPPNQGNYLPEVRKELKIYEAKTDKSSIDEPPEENTALMTVLKSHKRAIAWKLSDIKGIDPEFSTHKILMEEDFELESLGKTSTLCTKKGGFIVVENEENELILTRLVTGGMSASTIEKTTFTCPYGKFAYRRMPFGLCNAPDTFQRCMMAIFHDMIEKTMEVFMDDFSVFGNSFQTCLSHLENMLKRCEDTNLFLNWEKSNFMVKEGIVLGHKISKEGIEVDKAKVDVITKLPHPTTVKGIRIFLGHAGFYRRFIKDFSKIARLMTRLLKKDTLFYFSKECVEAFQTLKRKLTEAPILIDPD
uniref:Reverse transcriptase domain-containing protein n=1 Tax=Tanacetum cinerariifolium TaxID=118510 RepID=A0A6L2LDY8_TANCI|nr:reverse transcriptase domain-containing protein [Tanacetum cinerariifolium]